MMIYEKDWMMKQIESVIIFIIFLLTGEKRSQLEVLGTDDMPYNSLYSSLHQRVLEQDYIGVEEELFNAIEEDDADAFNATIIFYFQLNRLGDEDLEKHNFSRERILDGLKEVCRVYGVPIDLVLRE